MVRVDFKTDIARRVVEQLDRRGKSLMIGLSNSRDIVISPVLIGALMWWDPPTPERMLASTILVFESRPGYQIRYFDQNKIGACLLHLSCPVNGNYETRKSEGRSNWRPTITTSLQEAYGANNASISSSSVPQRAIKVLRERIGSDIHRNVRDFLKVHGNKNHDCPLCSSTITIITANKRETSYWRSW